MQNGDAVIHQAYSVQAAAERLGLSVFRVYSLVHDGRLERAYLAGGKLMLVTAASVEREIARRREAAR
jgi:excisionase family DNA binding protein